MSATLKIYSSLIYQFADARAVATGQTDISIDVSERDQHF